MVFELIKPIEFQVPHLPLVLVKPLPLGFWFARLIWLVRNCFFVVWFLRRVGPLCVDNIIRIVEPGTLPILAHLARVLVKIFYKRAALHCHLANGFESIGINFLLGFPDEFLQEVVEKERELVLWRRSQRDSLIEWVLRAAQGHVLVELFTKSDRFLLVYEAVSVDDLHDFEVIEATSRAYFLSFAGVLGLFLGGATDPKQV